MWPCGSGYGEGTALQTAARLTSVLPLHFEKNSDPWFVQPLVICSWLFAALLSVTTSQAIKLFCDKMKCLLRMKHMVCVFGGAGRSLPCERNHCLCSSVCMQSENGNTRDAAVEAAFST